MFMSEPKSIQLAGLLLPAANLPIYWRGQPEVIIKVDFFEWEKFIQSCQCQTMPFYKQAILADAQEKLRIFYLSIANTQVKELCVNGANSTVIFPCVNNTMSLSEIIALLKDTEISTERFSKFCDLNSLRCQMPPDCFALRSYSFAEKQI